MRTLRVADLEAKPGEKVCPDLLHIIGADFGIPVTLYLWENKKGENSF